MNKKLFLSFLCFSLVISSLLHAQQYNGYTLYSGMGSSTAYLMDTNLATFKTWSGLSATTGYSSYLMPGGILVRSADGGTSPTGVPGGPICGKVQKHDYSGNLVWNFTYAGTDYITHHDICPMPNGNVLVIVYERITAAQVTAAGGTSAIEMWPDKIVEIEPTGLTTGNVVWQWRSWDHLMQDKDSTKPNYVPTAQMVDHPESLNINYKQAKDWQHMNGLDYNPILDQIAWSSHNHNEWYIIDHSTTTAEAASHSGGNSGKGGDILYRWGNPPAYGAPGTAILNVTHDAHWIPEGRPNAGRLVGFNNKGVTSPSNKSCVDQIVTPVSGYTYTKVAGQAYGPTTYAERHISTNYTTNMGNSHQLPNGNMIVSVPTANKIYELNSSGTVLWTKAASSPQAFKYDSCYLFNTPPAIPTITATWQKLTSSTATSYQWFLNGVLIIGATSQIYSPTASGVYVVRITDVNGCVFQYSKGTTFTMAPAGLNNNDLSNEITIYPNPSTGIFTIKDELSLGNNFIVSVYDNFGQLLLNFSNTKSIDLTSLSNGMYSIVIKSEKGVAAKKVTLVK